MLLLGFLHMSDPPSFTNFYIHYSKQNRILLFTGTAPCAKLATEYGKSHSNLPFLYSPSYLLPVYSILSQDSVPSFPAFSERSCTFYQFSFTKLGHPMQCSVFVVMATAIVSMATYDCLGLRNENEITTKWLPFQNVRNPQRQQKGKRYK